MINQYTVVSHIFIDL